MPTSIDERAGRPRSVSVDLRGLPGRLAGGRAWPRLLIIAWLGFLAVPVGNFSREPASPEQVVLVSLVVAAVLGTFVWALPGSLDSQVGRRSLVLPAVSLAAAVVLTLAVSFNWDTVFLFAAVAAGRLRPASRGVAAVVLVTAAAAGTVVAGAMTGGLPAGTTFGVALNFVLNALVIGLVAVSIISMLISIAELRAARAEIARLAVAEERTRIARDLHDLLGHTLSLIALKSELAGRLLPENPARAGEEIRDIETVARDSLREVREAVAGYRLATLSAELAGSRVLLEAAGIACDVQRDVAFLPESADEPLGWAVREGVTNVIRHSGASQCWIRTRHVGDEFGIEILDDGRGADRPAVADRGARGSRVGHGLAGLAERASVLGGRLEAGRRPEGGFRLAVWVLAGAAPARSAEPLTGPRPEERTGATA
jgi:two-component system sensor histidine kinase DesK